MTEAYPKIDNLFGIRIIESDAADLDRIFLIPRLDRGLSETTSEYLARLASGCRVIRLVGDGEEPKP